MTGQIEHNLRKDRTCTRLFEMATPQLYRQNAFRILGLPIHATMCDIKRRHTKLKMREKLGMNLARENSGYLPLNPSPDKDDIAKAVQRLQNPEARLLDELFWFWPRELGTLNDDGLELLANNRINDAIALWTSYEERGTCSKVSTHNLAVLYHATVLDLEHKATGRALKKNEMEMYRLCWKRSYRRWKKLLDDEDFWSRLKARIRVLDDPRLTTGTARRIRSSLPKTLLLINARLALRAVESDKKQNAQRHITMIQKFGSDKLLVNDALRHSLSNIHQRLKAICAPVEDKANENPEQANKVASQFIEAAKPLLSTIDQLLPKEDVTRSSMHDEVVGKALLCLIIYGNKTEDWKTFVEFLESIAPLAVGESIRTRIKDDIKIGKDNIKQRLCFFCELKQKDDAAEIEVAMHGELRNEYVNEYQYRTTWKYIKIKVPRCSECKSYHEVIVNWVSGLAILAGIIGIAGFLIHWLAGLICIAFCACIGAAIGSSIGQSKVPYEIKPKSDKKNFHSIKELLSKGWTFGERPSEQ